jgi:hypothetical protein
MGRQAVMISWNRGVADILIAVVDCLKGFPDRSTASFPKRRWSRPASGHDDRLGVTSLFSDSPDGGLGILMSALADVASTLACRRTRLRFATGCCDVIVPSLGPAKMTTCPSSASRRFPTPTSAVALRADREFPPRQRAYRCRTVVQLGRGRETECWPSAPSHGARLRLYPTRKLGGPMRSAVTGRSDARSSTGASDPIQSLVVMVRR